MTGCQLAGHLHAQRLGRRSRVRGRLSQLPLCASRLSASMQSSLALPDVRLRRLASIPLIGDQLVGDVVLVDVADVRDRLATDPLRGDAFDVVEPEIGIEASLLCFTPELSQASGPRVVGGECPSASCSDRPWARP